MAIRTSLPFDREKRSAHQPACLCRFRGALSWIEINNRRRRTVARGSSGIGARTQDRHLLSRIARRGAEVVAEKFDRRVQVQTLEELYLEALAAPSART